MNWCFAIINNKAGEIYFDKNKNSQIKFFLKIFPSRGGAARLEHRRMKGKNSSHGK